MGIVPPTATGNLLPPGRARAVARALPRRGWPSLLFLLATGAAVGWLGLTAGGAAAVGVLPWVLATSLGAGAWARAAARSHGRLRAAWWALAIACTIGLVAHVGWAYEATVGVAGRVPLSLYLLVVPHILTALGAALALGRRRGAGSVTLATDALLLTLAAAVGLLRWVVEPMMAEGGAGDGRLAVLAVLQCVAVVPVLPAWLVVLQRRALLPSRGAVLLLLSTLLLATGSLLRLSGANPRPLVPGDLMDWIGLGGWILLAGSGLASGQPAATARDMLLDVRARDRLRKMLVPGAALFLGVIAVDIALWDQPRAETVLAVAALGAVLALRTAQALSQVDREAERRLQLVRTQTLVEVTHSLAGTTDLDETLRVISESARTVLGTRAAGVELVTEDGHELVTRSVVGLPPEEVVGLRFPLETSFTGWVVVHGEPRATTDPSTDLFIQPQSLAFLERGPVAAAPIRFRGETLGALFACIRPDPFQPDELHLLGALAEQAAIAIQNARLFEQVMVLSITDPLTGLANRRQLERELSREFAAAGRGRALVAVIFDLDDFKTYNDTHGHLAGDEALQAFATALREETRAMNLAARYGGDEFVALLAGADATGARTFIERVRIRFRHACLELGRGQLNASAGIAVWSPDVEHPDELLRLADNQLYQSKSRVRT